MMHMTKGWSGLRTAVIALSLFAWTTTGVKAAAVPNLLDYSTAGLIMGPTGISGTNVISFVPVGTSGSPAAVDPNSNLPLGSFQVAALPDGSSTTYDNTPFQISFIPTSFGGTKLTGVNPVMLTGTLNGQITGNYASSVKVAFDPVADGTFQLGGVPSTINILQNDQKLLVPSSAGGTTTLEATIVTSGHPGSPAAAPEPSTIALFLSTIGGLGLRRYVLSRRRQNRA
jgi:hypothetical protein